MPTVLRKFGYRFHFYSNEGQEPPHVHVTGKGGELKIWLKTSMIEYCYNISPADQRLILKLVEKNKVLFVEKWNEFYSKKN